MAGAQGILTMTPMSPARSSLSPGLERPFRERVEGLPRLGLGISTEFGAGESGLDIAALAHERPELIEFLEIGCDLERGFDRDAKAWIQAGGKTTYHFLDVNLEQEQDLDDLWIERTTELARSARAAWLCGDAGLWHVGPRDRGHGTLMPPILVEDSARALARSVRLLRRQSGFEVLPENPPSHVYVGDLHLCDYFALVAREADCGLLLDVAHLALYQLATGNEPLAGLDRLPLERLVEIHVAGSSPFGHAGRTFHDDDHSPDVLPETWAILERVLPRATNLRALVFECERNEAAQVIPVFERLRAALDQCS